MRRLEFTWLLRNYPSVMVSLSITSNHTSELHERIARESELDDARQLPNELGEFTTR
jgi:hypothetical protein